MHVCTLNVAIQLLKVQLMKPARRANDILVSNVNKCIIWWCYFLMYIDTFYRLKNVILSKKIKECMSEWYDFSHQALAKWFTVKVATMVKV